MTMLPPAIETRGLSKTYRSKAGPVVAVSMLTLVVLAILSKIAPEANVLFLSFPLRIAMGLIMVGFFFPFLQYFVKEFVTWMDKLLPL